MERLQHFFPGLTVNKLARWGAIIGSFALLTALVIYLVEDRLEGPAFALLVLGIIGLASWILVAPDELRDWLTGRQVFYGTGTVVIILVVVAVAIIGYSIVERQNIVRDLTEYQIFSISEPARQALRQLEARLQGTGYTAQITGFYNREQLRERESAAVLLRQFVEESSGLLKLTFYDPDIEPLLARRYGYGVGEGSSGGPLYLAIMDPNRAIFTIESIGTPDERSVATAMLRVAVAGQFKVYFTTDHGEYDSESGAELGLSGARFVLASTGFLVDTLALNAVDTIPADATAIVIAGPQIPFTQADVDKIAAYIERGGRVLITSDPPNIDPLVTIAPNRALMVNDPLNQYLWNEFGVRFQDAVLSDSGSSGPNPFVIVPQINPQSGVLSGIGNIPIVLAVARSTEVLELTAEQPQFTGNQALYRRELLMLTSPQSFGETTLTTTDLSNLAQYDPATDLAGPLVLAVAVRRVDELDQDAQPRVVLLGDTDWLTNFNIQPTDGSDPVEGNFRLWTNVVEWLTQYSEIASIAVANRPDKLPIFVTRQQQTRIQLVTLVVMPGIVLGVGIIVWGLRRRH